VAKTKQAEQQNGNSALIEVPLGEVHDKEYCSSHVESKLRTPQQRKAFRRLLRGLQQAGATTESGRPVSRGGDVIRWILEQVGE
jgi:hypothetical protein